MPRLSGRQKLWQPGEVAGRHGHRELRANPVEAAVNGLGHAADGLGPSEGLLDLLAVPLGQGVATVMCGASVDGGMA